MLQSAIPAASFSVFDVFGGRKLFPEFPIPRAGQGIRRTWSCVESRRILYSGPPTRQLVATTLTLSRDRPFSCRLTKVKAYTTIPVPQLCKGADLEHDRCHTIIAAQPGRSRAHHREGILLLAESYTERCHPPLRAGGATRRWRQCAYAQLKLILMHQYRPIRCRSDGG